MADKKGGGGECIQVCVRCRPMNTKEKNENRGHIIDMDLEACQVFIKHPGKEGEEPKGFTFDAVYDENTIQRNFYDESCFTLIESVLEGFNGTIFAYGQTGCGKSFTMQGPAGVAELKGVIPNAIAHVFEAIGGSKDVNWLVRCSYLEIYNEEIKDLLADPKNPPKCDIKEDPEKGIFVKGLSEVVVESEGDMDNLLDRGQQSRTVAATAMNAESSRSHSIFTVVIEASSTDPESGREMIRAGKLNLVDLAGSERQKKTGASGDRLREGAKINLSLTALGNVISALAAGKGGHVPYRDSKLTRLLQDSLGGNTKTLMVAAISPADYNFDETMSTLRYANRAKNIKNIPRINEDPKDAMLREYKDEIEKLKAMLAAANAGGAAPGAMSVAADAPAPIDFAAMAGGGGGNESALSRTAELDEALKAKEDEIAEERRQREELAERLKGMMAKMQGQGSALSMPVQVAVGGAAPVEPSSDQLEKAERERVELERVHRERLVKAKKKAEKKARLEMERMAKEKEAMADELSELRAMLEEGGQSVAGSDNQAQSHVESVEAVPSSPTRIDDSKLRAVKKKYDKRIRAMQRDMDDLQEEHHFDRERLLEELRQQAQDTRLYELICQSVLSDKELKRAVDKARWDEEESDWVIPYMKGKGRSDHGGHGHGNTMLPSGKPNMAATQRFGGGGGDNMMPKLGGGGALPTIGKGGGMGNRYGMGEVSSSLPQLPTATTKQQMGMTMNMTNMNFGGEEGDNPKKKKKNKKRDGALPSVLGATGGGFAGGGGVMMPPLQSNNVNMDHIAEGIYNDDDGEDSGDYISSAPSSSTVATGLQSNVQYVPNLIDEAGSGENAGAISEWGFADDDTHSKRSHLGEDDLVSMNSGYSGGGNNNEKKKKKKSKKQERYEDEDEGPVRRSRVKQKSSPRGEFGGGSVLPRLA